MSLPLLALTFAFLPAAHALEWLPAGPTGQPVYPPVIAVAVSPSAPQVVYAAAGGGLYRSADAGAAWTQLGIPSSTIEQLAADPTNSAIVYLVSQRHVYRSDDGGLTWKDLHAPLGNVSASNLRIDPQNPSILYLGARCDTYPMPSGGGVLKSTDRGESWVQLSAAVTCVDFLALDPAAPHRLFASTSTGAQLRTDDAGATWHRASEIPVFDVVADPLAPSRHFGLGHGPSIPDYLHFVVSTDSGATWTRIPSQGLPQGAQQLAIDRTTRRLFLLGQSFGLFVSDDLGLHWRPVEAVPALTATPLMMAGADDVLYVATARGLYRLPMSDPESPTVIHLGEPSPARLTVYRLALDPNDASTLYATALEGYGILNAYRVFRSTDAGATWERITAEDDTRWRFAIAVDAVGDLYAADTQTMWRFAKTTQTWESWTVPELGQPAIFLANPRRPGWLYAANAGWAGYSIDGGRTWTRIPVPGGFWSLSIAPNGSDLAGGNSDGAFASSDGGVTWRALPTGRLVTKSIALAPSRPATIYRLTNTAAGLLLSGLFRSDDHGQTWTPLHWPGEHDFSPPIAVDPRDPRSLWIGSAHSSDGGETWIVDPPTPPITSVLFDRTGSALYGVSRDSSVWKAAVREGRRRSVRG